MTTLQTYISHLCTSHTAIHHSDAEPHFACSADSAQTAMATRLRYPAVFLDAGDFIIGGETGHKLLRRALSMTFVTHVADSGHATEVQAAFERTESLLMDFVARMEADRRTGVAAVRGVQFVGAEGHRVELEGAGLYGWMLFFSEELPLKLCLPDVNPFEE